MDSTDELCFDNGRVTLFKNDSCMISSILHQVAKWSAAVGSAYYAAVKYPPLIKENRKRFALTVGLGGLAALGFHALNSTSVFKVDLLSDRDSIEITTCSNETLKFRTCEIYLQNELSSDASTAFVVRVKEQPNTMFYIHVFADHPYLEHMKTIFKGRNIQ